MTKKEKSTADESKGPNVQLISVILGFVGVLLTVLAGIFGPIIQEQIKTRNQPTQTPIVIVATATDVPVTPTPVPTDTVPPGEPTSTPAPTDTPVPPTATPIPVGFDWANDCISTLWVPHPASVQTAVRDGCYSQPLDVFFADNGRLSFLYDGRLSSAEVHGLFAPLPSSGTVDLQVYLRELKNGNLWMGVFSEPSLSAKGMLLSIPSGDVKRRPFVQWDMPGPVKVLDTVTFQQNPPIYSVQQSLGAGGGDEERFCYEQRPRSIEPKVAVPRLSRRHRHQSAGCGVLRPGDYPLIWISQNQKGFNHHKGSL